MDAVPLNNSPDLTMEQITKQLFNNEYLSDVQFHVEGKVIFAHSWELLKRSIVFQEQFRGNLGYNKLITIGDVTYDAFFQFVRFIYTDKCEIVDNTVCDMLNLSRRYKILKLETKLLNFLTSSYDTDLKLLEYGFTNKYELIYNNVFDLILCALECIIDQDLFVKINLNVLEEILKSNRMPSSITEVKLYETLVRWINKSCEISQTPKSQRRSHFDQLFRLIRFPAMTTDEFYLCVQNDPDLFTDDDISTICQKIVLRDQSKITKWPTEIRFNYSDPCDELTQSSDSGRVSKFMVSDKLILHGIRCGSGYGDFNITITGKFWTTNSMNVLRFNFAGSAPRYTTVSLGESIKLKPNAEYTIEIKYVIGESKVYGRKHNVNLIVTGPSDLVTFTETSKDLFEIFFKLPTN